MTSLDLHHRAINGWYFVESSSSLIVWMREVIWQNGKTRFYVLLLFPLGSLAQFSLYVI